MAAISTAHVIVFLLGMTTFMVAASELKQRFASLRGKNLEGEEYLLPSGLEGTRNLVVVAFQREQQADVDTWLPLAERLATESSEFRFYEVPLLANSYRIFRGFIDGGMRSGIPDIEARRRTITVYTDKSKAMRDLEIAYDGSIHTFLLGKNGKIIWRAEGRWSQEKEAGLITALESARKPRKEAAKQLVTQE
jgi:hypothetical protein